MNIKLVYHHTQKNTLGNQSLTSKFEHYYLLENEPLMYTNLLTQSTNELVEYAKLLIQNKSYPNLI